LPENPALIKAFFRAGMRRTVKMNAAREKPQEACKGWPSRLKMRAPETTRPASVRPETRIEFEDGIVRSQLVAIQLHDMTGGLCIDSEVGAWRCRVVNKRGAASQSPKGERSTRPKKFANLKRSKFQPAKISSTPQDEDKRYTHRPRYSMLTKAKASSKEAKPKSRPSTEKPAKTQPKKASKPAPPKTVESEEEDEESPSDLENEVFEEDAHNDLVDSGSDDDV
jgi:hypothetical protein